MATNLNTTNLSRRSALAGAVAAFAALPASVAFADPAAASDPFVLAVEKMNAAYRAFPTDTDADEEILQAVDDAYDGVP